MSRKDEWLTACVIDGTPGDYVLVNPEAVIGDYALHPALRYRSPIGPEWTVTHRPSGLTVWIVAVFSDAVRVAQWLVDNKTIPGTAHEALLWKQNLTPEARTVLTVALSSIAPRMTVKE